ncbi:hypothetical protein [Streptomyces sp. KL116D]|uniref:hypothetical protein n=1 Tax=Streptomyces sp. KL116D TaxID=3045152 RepID=UPI00355887A9
MTIRTLPNLTDDAFCEISVDGVRLTRDDVLGEVDDGWRMISELLVLERTGIDFHAKIRHWLDSVADAVPDALRDRYTELDARLTAGHALAWRMVAGLDAAGPIRCWPPCPSGTSPSRRAKWPGSSLELRGRDGLLTNQDRRAGPRPRRAGAALRPDAHPRLGHVRGDAAHHRDLAPGVAVTTTLTAADPLSDVSAPELRPCCAGSANARCPPRRVRPEAPCRAALAQAGALHDPRDSCPSPNCWARPSTAGYLDTVAAVEALAALPARPPRARRNCSTRCGRASSRRRFGRARPALRALRGPGQADLLLTVDGAAFGVASSSTRPERPADRARQSLGGERALHRRGGRRQCRSCCPDGSPTPRPDRPDPLGQAACLAV